MAKRIVMIIAHTGFRDEEYWVPKGIFEQAGIQVTTASSQKAPAVSKFGKNAAVDMELADIQCRDFEAILYVGGPGCREFFNDETAHRLAREFLANGKWLTAICSAPVILARAGLLTGKNATVFPGDKAELKANGAHYSDQPVVVDGRIITGSGPEAAPAFAQTILKLLQ